MSERAQLAVLRIATLNCLNFALPGQPTYRGVVPLTAAEFELRADWLAHMLVRLDADLVLVQEIFHEDALAAAVARAGSGLSARVPLAGSGNTRPRLGLVWRAPWQPRIDTVSELPPGCAVEVPEIGSHAHFSRPLLRARVALDAIVGAPLGLTLLNLHLKSRRPVYAAGEDEADPRVHARAALRALVTRGAEAAAARALVLASLDAGEAVVAGGDFNAGATEVTTTLVADSGAAAEGLPADRHTLFDALELAPGARRTDAGPTYIDNGRSERIDHLFVSAHFAPQAAADGALGRVLMAETLAEHLPRRRRLARSGAEIAAEADRTRIESDHAAVSITLGLRRA